MQTRRIVWLLVPWFAGVAAALAPDIHAQEPSRAVRTDAADDKRWQAVAPGRVEPASGEIKIGAPIVGVIGEVLVKANDKVLAGEPLIRLIDNEAQARLTTVEAQIGLRRRLRNDENPSARAATRRRAEDAVADADKGVMEAQAALDRAAIERRAGRGSDADVDAARTSLTRAQDRQKQQKAELRRVEADTNTPLPSQNEGQLNIARTELAQVNAKPGELASPSGGQPLIVLGDVSALRIRAELDERDFGEIKIGQPVLARAAAFRGREFAGKVAFIAPIVEPGRINSRGQRNMTDVDVIEVSIDLAEPDTLAVGMKVDVYFRSDTPQH